MPAQYVKRHRFLLTRKSVAVSGMVALVVASGLINLRLQQSNDTNVLAAAGRPEYATVLPSGKPIEKLGGWKRISPPGKDPVFAFADTIAGVPVSVSEQPLPANFKDDAAGQLAKLAEKFSATNKLESGNIAVYVGISVKGPQSALLVKNDLLIMIKSQKKISDAAWKSYAASLK